MVMMVLWGLVSPQLLQKVMALYKADLELLWRQADWMCLASTRWQGLATMAICQTIAGEISKGYFKL